MTKTSGFTLIELIVVVAVVSLVTAVTIPGMVAWREGFQLRQATLELLAAVRRARIGAVKGNKKAILTFTPAGSNPADGMYLAFLDNGLDHSTFWTRQPDEPILKRGRIPEGVQLYDVSFAGGIPRVRFDHLGLPNGLGGHIYLTNARNQFMGIHVNINGTSRIVSSKGGRKGTWK